MSYTKRILSVAALALTTSFASAQEQDLSQTPLPDNTLQKRAPIYVVLPTLNGELMRHFTACTSDNHYVTGNYALRADIAYANVQIENGGLEALSRQASLDGFIYQRAVTEVIGNMTLADLRRSQIASSTDQAQMRKNVATVHDHFTQGQSNSVEYVFHINKSLFGRPSVLCPQA